MMALLANGAWLIYIGRMCSADQPISQKKSKPIQRKPRKKPSKPVHQEINVNNWQGKLHVEEQPPRLERRATDTLKRGRWTKEEDPSTFLQKSRVTCELTSSHEPDQLQPQSPTSQDPDTHPKLSIEPVSPNIETVQSGEPQVPTIQEINADNLKSQGELCVEEQPSTSRGLLLQPPVPLAAPHHCRHNPRLRQHPTTATVRAPPQQPTTAAAPHHCRGSPRLRQHSPPQGSTLPQSRTLGLRQRPTTLAAGAAPRHSSGTPKTQPLRWRR